MTKGGFSSPMTSCDSDPGAKDEQLRSVRTGCHLFHGSFHPSGAAGEVLAHINMNESEPRKQRQI